MAGRRSQSILEWALMGLILASFNASSIHAGDQPELFLGACPYGHEHLVWTPTDTGHRSLSTTVPPLGIVCEQCGFKSIDPRNDDDWIREASEPGSFEVPLHPIIHSLPILPVANQGAPLYRQRVREGALLGESLEYMTTERLGSIIQRFEEHFASSDAAYRAGLTSADRWQATFPGEPFDVDVTVFQISENLSAISARHHAPQQPSAQRRSATAEPNPRQPDLARSRSVQPGSAQGRSSSSSPAQPIPDAPFPIPEAPPDFLDTIEEPVDPRALPSTVTYRPPTVVRRVQLQIPKEARESGVHGSVIATVTVGRDGEVTDIEIVRSLGPEIDNAVIKALRASTYNPATVNGKRFSGSLNLATTLHVPGC